MKGIAFTFDDDVVTHYDVVRPIFEKYGFRCTFFINGSQLNLWNGLTDVTGQTYYVPDMNDSQIASLHERGFEIGNHTYEHVILAHVSPEVGMRQIQRTEEKLAELKIPRPESFAYPAYIMSSAHIEPLCNLGYKLARIGYSQQLDRYLNNHPAEWTRNASHYYVPGSTNRFAVTCSGLFCDAYTFEIFRADIEQAPKNAYCVFTGHVFIRDYQISKLERICEFCQKENIRVLRFGDLPLSNV